MVGVPKTIQNMCFLKVLAHRLSLLSYRLLPGVSFYLQIQIRIGSSHFK